MEKMPIRIRIEPLGDFDVDAVKVIENLQNQLDAVRKQLHAATLENGRLKIKQRHLRQVVKMLKAECPPGVVKRIARV